VRYVRQQEVRNWGFLSGVKIPPLVFFPASEGFVDKTASHLALKYTKKGNMTEDAFAGVVLPHIKKYNPGCRVVVFDSVPPSRQRPWYLGFSHSGKLRATSTHS
jgi:hypothetical protein